MRRVIKRFSILVLMLLLAVVAVGVLLIVRDARRATAAADPLQARRRGEPIPVRTALVAETQVEQVIGATALSVPSEVVPIRIGASRKYMVAEARMRAVHARQGDFVHQGDLLFEQEDAEAKQVVGQAKAGLEFGKAELERVREQVSYNQKLRELQLESAQADVKYRDENLGYRKKENEVVQGLYKEKASSVLELYESITKQALAVFEVNESQRRLERAKVEMEIGALNDKAAIAKAAEQLELKTVELAEAEHDLERHSIKSPLDGFVDFGSTGEIRPGTVVAVNSVLCEVVKTDPLQLRVDFPQERLDEVAVGQAAEIVLDSFPKETFYGKVARISPQVNAQLRVLPVLVELPNPDFRLRAGVSGFVRLRASKKAIIAPATAVIEHGTKSMVFKVENGRAHMREVRVGRLTDIGMVQILDGLQAGDEVVIYHDFYPHARDLATKEGYLQDNDPVDVNWRKWARRE